VYTYPMSRRSQITFSDRQHNFLLDESARSGLSMAELVRRAVDTTYRPGARERARGVEVSFSIWRQPDVAAIGRRPAGRIG
jgi:hypothetical protein